MKSYIFFALILVAFLLTGCLSPIDASQGINIGPSNISSGTELENPTNTATPEINNTSQPGIEAPISEPSPTPTLTPTPDPFSQLYDCDMEIDFTSGPLEKKSTEFKVLGKDYFIDKGDKFAVGKGTGIYYENQRYFIIHSAYLRGNILRPMEAEFLRKYLEYWGGTGNQYIQGQIDSLIGSQVIWRCNEEETFRTEIGGIARLSHEASDQLWLNPRDLETIIQEKAGESSEWIGGISPSSTSSIYLAFCGWGPESLGDERFTYYRYLFQFNVVP
jgi:hypothetical protein